MYRPSSLRCEVADQIDAGKAHLEGSLAAPTPEPAGNAIAAGMIAPAPEGQLGAKPSGER